MTPASSRASARNQGASRSPYSSFLRGFFLLIFRLHCCEEKGKLTIDLHVRYSAPLLNDLSNLIIPHTALTANDPSKKFTLEFSDFFAANLAIACAFCCFCWHRYSFRCPSRGMVVSGLPL